MEENSRQKSYITNHTLITCAVLAVIGLIIFFFVFITNYSIAYDDSAEGGFIPYSFAVKYYFFLGCIVLVGISFLLKLIFNEKIQFRLLILVSVIVTILSYNLNYYTLYPDTGPLYSLVDEDGPLYFIRNRDYDLDGINDREYYLNNTTRTEKSSTHTYLNDYLDALTLEVTGTGKLSSAVESIGDSSKAYYDAKLSYNQKNLTIEKAVIEFRFIDENVAKKAVILLKGETVETASLKQEYNGKNIITVTLDKAFFDKLSPNDYSRTSIYFNVGLK